MPDYIYSCIKYKKLFCLNIIESEEIKFVGNKLQKENKKLRLFKQTRFLEETNDTVVKDIN